MRLFSIWEWKASTLTDIPTGKLPTFFTRVHSIFFAHGFLFVGYRDTPDRLRAGDAHIYYQRGGQWGTTGVLRVHDTNNVNGRVYIGGMIGDDLIYYYNNAIWAYDLSAGATFMVAAATGDTRGILVTDCAVIGKDIVIANIDGGGTGQHFDTDLYTTDVASWESGRFDFDLPGIKKTLLRVTVVTDGLDALTSMTCKVSADGATFATVAGTHEDDGATTFTWVVSKSGNEDQQTTGYDFGIQLLPLTTSSAVTPKIREIFAEAISAEKRRGVEIDVDLRSDPRGKGASGTALLAQLREASEYAGGIVRWKDPFAVAETDPVRESDVMVELMGGERDQQFATIRMWETELVG